MSMPQEADTKMEEIESLLGFGGGPLVDAHESNTQVEVDPNVNVDTGDHSTHTNTTTTFDDHSFHQNITYQQVVQQEEHVEHHGGGGHHAVADPAIMELQISLQNDGFDPGPIDGVMGPRTRAAMEARSHAEHGGGSGQPEHPHGHEHGGGHAQPEYSQGGLDEPPGQYVQTDNFGGQEFVQSDDGDPAERWGIN
jgi:hypothetical protein